jgi:hypothetical protein
MGFELNEAGITFIVGAFTILTADGISWVLFGKHLTGFFEGRLGLTENGAVTAGVFFGFSFAAGLLMEDLTYKYSDPFIYPPLQAANALFGGGRGAGEFKRELQRSVLIDEFSDCNPVPSPLGRSLFNLRAFTAIAGHRGTAIEDWGLYGGKLPLPSQSTPGDRYSGLYDGIAAVFYFAKNRVFMIDNYYDELRRLHSRLEFSRTIAIISLGAAAVCTIGLLVAAFQRFTLKRPYRPLLRGLALAGALITLYVLSTAAYLHESVEYNKRVFGYYDSMIRAERSKPVAGDSACGKWCLP